MLLTEHERSVQARIPLRCRVTATWTGRPPIEGETLDVSASGALLALPASLPLGVELHLLVDLPDAEGAMELVALTVRAEPPGTDGAAHRLGVHFISASESAIRRIGRLIYG